MEPSWAMVVLSMVLLLVAITEMASFGAHASLISGSVNIGSACFYDEECETVTTFCRDRKSCTCKDYFREAEGRCVAMVGARCQGGVECSSLENSHCVDSLCVCREGYVRQAMDLSCLPVVHIYQGACEEDTQCQLSFGDLALCQDSMCQCLNGRHFADGACWSSKGLGETCRNTTDCSYNQDQRHKVHCLNGVCQCKEGYVRNNLVCDDGAAQLTLSLAAVFFVLIRFTIT